MRQASIKRSLAGAALSVLFSAALAQTPTEAQRVPRDLARTSSNRVVPAAMEQAAKATVRSLRLKPQQVLCAAPAAH